MRTPTPIAHTTRVSDSPHRLGPETVSPIRPRPTPATMSPSALVLHTPRRLLIVPDSAPKNGSGTSAGSVASPAWNGLSPRTSWKCWVRRNRVPRTQKFSSPATRQASASLMRDGWDDSDRPVSRAASPLPGTSLGEAG